MLVDASASEQHFAEHLAPIWLALSPELRGAWYSPARLHPMLASMGIPAISGKPPKEGPPLLVASWKDHRAVAPRATVFLNHGVGQRYDGDPRTAGHPSYSGALERKGVLLYLCPNEVDAEVCRVGAEAIAVGCPKLDRWCDISRNNISPKVTVAFSFHWDCWLCPETRWAFPFYRSAVVDLARDLPLIGHAHPRAWRRLDPFYASIDVERRARFDEIVPLADLYVCDNSSTLYEFAAAGKPVLCLNAPWYRRQIEHGLRFWDHVPGLQVDQPGALKEMIEEALSDPSEAQRIRETATDRTYAALDGRAAARAAEAIEAAEAPRRAGTLNPKAPRTVKGRTGSEPRFPEERLRRLGAEEAELTEARKRWDDLDQEGQREAFNEMAALTDDQIRGALEEMRADAITGVPGGV